MDKKEIIKTLKFNKILKSGDILEYERGKRLLGINCTPEEYEFRIKILSDYLRI